MDTCDAFGVVDKLWWAGVGMFAMLTLIVFVYSNKDKKNEDDPPESPA